MVRYVAHAWADIATQVSPSGAQGAYYSWNDINEDKQVTTDELIGYPTSGILGFYGFDPLNPTKIDSPNGIDKNFGMPLTDEILLGLERELFTDFSLSATLTLRRTHRWLWWPYPFYDKDSGKVFTKEDYVGPITGSIFNEYDGKTYDYEYWTLNQFRPAGDYLGNNPGNYNLYRGLEIVARKCLSHRWMMNASFTYQVFTDHYGDEGFFDPTNIDELDGSRIWGADWMAKLSFLYQLPWGFNISCFANARQGYSIPQYIRVPSPERGAVGMGSVIALYTEKPGETRLSNFYNVDLSLVKDFYLGEYGRLTLQMDAFNVFNFSHGLSRFRQVNSPRHNEIKQILNPRVIRFGIRYRF